MGAIDDKIQQLLKENVGKDWVHQCEDGGLGLIEKRNYANDKVAARICKRCGKEIEFKFLKGFGDALTGSWDYPDKEEPEP